VTRLEGFHVSATIDLIVWVMEQYHCTFIETPPAMS